MSINELSDAEEEAIAEVTNASWQAWVERGGLDAVEQTLGPVKTQPYSNIFVAGWKLGFAQSVRTSILISQSLGLKPPRPRK